MRYQDGYRSKTLRMSQWDYTSDAVYFVTINLRGRSDWFLESDIKAKAKQYWNAIPQHFPHVQCDEFVVMPDHAHGILVFDSSVETREQRSSSVETRHGVSLQNAISPNRKPRDFCPNRFGTLRAGSLPSVINHYKGSVTRWCRKNNYQDFYWQKGYFERRIRSVQEFQNTRRYIEENPITHRDDD